MQEISGIKRSAPSFLYGCILLVSISCLYWKTLFYPFIQDDWCILYSIIQRGGTFPLQIISGYAHATFYRPVAQLLVFLLYQCFGLHSFGYHVILLLLHAANALLVVLLLTKITKNTLLAWTTGVCYAIAFNVHLDTLVWVVGLYDVLGFFFFLVSIVFYVKRNTVVSALLFILALLTKESGAILPPVLLIIELFVVVREYKIREVVTASIRSLRHALPHWGILAVFLILRSGVLSARAGQGSLNDPYQLSLVGMHIVHNIITYVSWAVRSLVPFTGSTEFGKMLGAGLLLCPFIFHKQSVLGIGKNSLLIGWFLIGLLPVIFLTHHVYTYYLIFSLAPVMLVMLDGAQSLLRSMLNREKAVASVMLLLIGVNVVYSYSALSEIDRLGYNIPTVQGSNNLTRKVAIVGVVQDYLVKNHPTLPKHTNLIFDWVPTAAFCRNAGPRIWYGDTTLNVYEIQEVIIDTARENGTRQPTAMPDSAGAILLTFHGESMGESRVTGFTVRGSAVERYPSDLSP